MISLSAFAIHESKTSVICFYRQPYLLVFPSEKSVIERNRVGMPICDVGTFRVPRRRKACRTHHYFSIKLPIADSLGRDLLANDFVNFSLLLSKLRNSKILLNVFIIVLTDCLLMFDYCDIHVANSLIYYLSLIELTNNCLSS